MYFRACPPLKGQALLQKRRDVGRDRVHGRPPTKKARAMNRQCRSSVLVSLPDTNKCLRLCCCARR